jgi:hypothetical protein
MQMIQKRVKKARANSKNQPSKTKWNEKSTRKREEGRKRVGRRKIKQRVKEKYLQGEARPVVCSCVRFENGRTGSF